MADRIRAAAIACMMSTDEGLLDRSVRSHTWMFFPAGLAGPGGAPGFLAADGAACARRPPVLAGPHRCDLPMQETAFTWLDRNLRSAPWQGIDGGDVVASGGGVGR
jgi:hypothetical protein